ncbi:MAG TPA: hypothetical protein VG672_28210 [Bryobacteraceae bacterium]|nr:hypothetical protein [Bryobacteraceae bacterium]
MRGIAAAFCSARQPLCKQANSEISIISGLNYIAENFANGILQSNGFFVAGKEAIKYMNSNSQLSVAGSSKTAHTLQRFTESTAASLLVISPDQGDHRAIRQIFETTKWTVHYAYTWEEAQECLETYPVSVVLCERALPDATWRIVLKGLVHVSAAPMLVVASRLADEHLWAEVLNLGGYDVILKPFEPSETRWVAGTAAWKWQQQHTQSHLVC